MSNEEMLKADLERAVKLLSQSGNNTKQQVKLLLENSLEAYFKPKKYLTYKEAMKLNPSKTYKVKLNDNIYNLDISRDCFDDKYKYFMLSNEKTVSDTKYCYYQELTHQFCDEKQFFNDLHLELVEE